jgi:hypothetical protein
VNPIQSKIEQTAKEYLSYKSIADKEAEIAKKEKEQIAQKVLGMDEDSIYTIYFDTFGSLEFLVKDMLQVKAKLYNQIELAKDVVDIPKEITDLVADYKPIYTFAIIGDEKKLIDEITYNQIKQNYIQGSKEMAKLNK